MTKVNATEFQQNIGKYTDLAQSGPIVVTRHRRDSLVLVNVREYERLRALEDASDEMIQDVVDTHRGTLEKLADR